MRSLCSKRMIAGVAAAALTAALSGGGWALAASGGGVIHACANKHTGAVRVAGKCNRKQEKALSWNVTGPRGAAGPTGPKGATGATGAQGPAGPATGPAGGALGGSYPNPSLNVSGGDNGATSCKNGEALVGVSPLAALTCAPGVYSDAGLNVAAGPSPFGALTTGIDNAGFGPSTLSADTTGSYNSAFGQAALSANTTGGVNSAVGESALANNTTGSRNSALGQYALEHNTGGSDNTGVGYAALNFDTGSDNTAVGSGAMFSNGVGTNDTSVGHSALNSNTTGNNNTAVGSGSMSGNNTGIDSTSVGANALAVDSNSAFNSAFGQQALNALSSGAFNQAFGEEAGRNLQTGSNDLLLGYLAGASYTGSESSNIDIGNGGVTGDNNVIRIGTPGTGAGQQDQTFLAGVYGATVTSGATVLVNSSGQLGTVSSSERFKTDIHGIGPWVQQLLMALRPVTFHYKAQYIKGQPNPLEYGLIAEQVAKVDPNLVVYGADHQPYTVAYQELPALLLAQVQRQQLQIEALRAQMRGLARLQAEVNALMHHAG